MSITLKNQNSQAEISLKNGGSLSSLVLDGNQIIKSEEKPLETFASSILFPFVNRIKEGKYNYNSQDFQFETNMPPNAIHGLVYDKEFKLVEQESTQQTSSVALIYAEKQRKKGFPFFYEINLKYTLEPEAISLKVSVKNSDSKAFPFSVGWHPYFWVESVDECELSIDTSEQFQVDKNMIPTASKPINWNGFKSLNNWELDDGFKLKDNEFKLKTPQYQIGCSMTSNENYLQIYTPEHRKSIAIEPMTAATDSFNNKIGLKNLKPNQTFEVEWRVELL